MPIVRETWESEYQEIGRRIRAAREAKRISRVELARCMKMTDSGLLRWETGQVRVGAVELSKIAEYLGVPFDYFLRPIERDGSADQHRVRLMREALNFEFAGAA